MQYTWSFGDGSSSTNPNPNHTYAAGSYTATLTVTDNAGATNSDTASVDVNAAPSAEANGDYLGQEGEPVSLSSAGSFDPCAYHELNSRQRSSAFWSPPSF